MERYLKSTTYIDWKHPFVLKRALDIADGCKSEEELTQKCFEFVRDSIKHSWDWKLNPVTCRASEALLHGTGYCYSKSHLLAALLRANGIPSSMCYQRLAIETEGPPYCIHSLNAVYLARYGWYRVDARGNKTGIFADFCPPVEKLAFPIVKPDEIDLPGIWPEPLPTVTKALTTYRTVQEVYENLQTMESEVLLTIGGSTSLM
ncbi:MAG: transglutaminase-like domain-containing protein [Desulfomonilaceae bacterium]